MPHNKKSEAVLRAVGFEDFGYCKDYLLIDGVWQDHQLTALTNKNWRDKQK
jgi:ribosomal-protein-alanine N-acetyltransferase